MKRSGILKKTVLACVLLMLMAGCSKYTRIEAFVEPEGRTVGFVPFRSDRAKLVSAADCILFAEMAADDFRAALPKEMSLSPSDMKGALSKGMNEARWYDIGLDTGAEVLVVGEVLSVEVWSDTLLGTHEGVIRFHLRVLDVTQLPPKPIATARGVSLRFPVEREAKFDDKYVNMDDKTFRHELLRYAASYVAGMFYAHDVRKDTVSRSDVTIRKEQ